MFTLAAILMFAIQGPPQVPPVSGSLAGCASDTSQQRLPGVTVVAKTGRVERTETTDPSGCYELRDLPAGSYRVTMRLAGFDNVTHDGVNIVSGGSASLDVVMHVSAICECLRFGDATLATQWSNADAVLHVRLSASESQPPTQAGYYRHVATVIDALKKPPASLPTPVFVLQNQRSAAPVPYDINQELVVFLQSSGSRNFVIMNDEPGFASPRESSDPAMAFLIQDGRIQRAPLEFSRYVGMPLDAFLGELRAFSSRQMNR